MYRRITCSRINQATEPFPHNERSGESCGIMAYANGCFFPPSPVALLGPPALLGCLGVIDEAVVTNKKKHAIISVFCAICPRDVCMPNIFLVRFRILHVEDNH